MSTWVVTKTIEDRISDFLRLVLLTCVTDDRMRPTVYLLALVLSQASSSTITATYTVTRTAFQSPERTVKQVSQSSDTIENGPADNTTGPCEGVLNMCTGDVTHWDGGTV